MMKANKIEDIRRIYAKYEGVPCKIEADRAKQVVSVEYNWTGDDNARRCFDAYACVNGDPDRFCMSEYANSDHDENWNCDVTVSFYGNLNNDQEILDLVESLLMNFFKAERAMKVFSKLEKAGLVK
jgi:hypothetical protein